MSPRAVRRYRAERLLQREFDALRGRVLAAVRARLRSSGVTLDQSDLDACYASAWQGLYMATLEGEEIESPAAWLVLVTFRRALEEHRTRGRVQRLQRQMQAETGRAVGMPESAPFVEHDLAAEMDRRLQLRQLLEGIRGRLSAREREAAVLCYLQGFSRAEAAERMGVSEKRMRKLMEGAGAGRPGVAGKVGELVETIRAGRWCDEQGSLMRALAFGVLDPDGERHKLALAHRDECPACRAYVLSLRGLAVTLPPVLLPWGLGAAALAREGARAGAAGTTGAGAGTSTGALSSGSAAGAGVGAAGGGAAGGGWLFAGGAKLAAGCVLALGLGAGCAALEAGVSHRGTHVRSHRRSAHASAAAGAAWISPGIAQAGTGGLAAAGEGQRSATAGSLTPSARASREFGPEQALASESSATSGARASRAHAAAVAAPGQETQMPRSGGGSGGAGSAGTGSAQVASTQAGSTGSAAEREFSPG